MAITDTGLWIALAYSQGQYHELAKKCLAEFSNRNERLITTCAVMTETCHFLLARTGGDAQLTFIKKYHRRLFDVFELHADHAAKVALIEKYADLPMDLADASLVIQVEHLGYGRILSTDERDFRTYRWKNRKPFENLLFP